MNTDWLKYNFECTKWLQHKVECIDTEVMDAEQSRRQAQAAIDKAMNALLGPCPF